MQEPIQGLDSRREPDVQIVGANGFTRKVFEAERLPDSDRNILREAEYERIGILYVTKPL